jgi:hypothetical protein
MPCGFIEENVLFDVMKVFGKLPKGTEEVIAALRRDATNLVVNRVEQARSKDPYPTSNDLERCIQPIFQNHKFAHHSKLKHPREDLSFEYDFFHAELGIATEIMGYRADDEIYKDILKFHVHPETRVGVVWVPKKKWISGKATDTNYQATIKALTLAGTFMNVEALVAIPYDWEPTSQRSSWKLVHPNGS